MPGLLYHLLPLLLLLPLTATLTPPKPQGVRPPHGNNPGNSPKYFAIQFDPIPACQTPCGTSLCCKDNEICLGRDELDSGYSYFCQDMRDAVVERRVKRTKVLIIKGGDHILANGPQSPSGKPRDNASSSVSMSITKPAKTTGPGATTTPAPTSTSTSGGSQSAPIPAVIGGAFKGSIVALVALVVLAHI